MQRWISILGICISSILIVLCIGTSVNVLVNLNHLWALLLTFPGCFIGTCTFTYFLIELANTFDYQVIRH